MLQPHESRFFPASFGLHPSLSRPGRTAIPAVVNPFERQSQGGKHFPSETAGSLPGARDETPTGQRRDPLVHGSALSALRLARRPDPRQARDLPRLASDGLSVALAMEIEATARSAKNFLGCVPRTSRNRRYCAFWKPRGQRRCRLSTAIYLPH
jgi:hypothetical protein